MGFGMPVVAKVGRLFGMLELIDKVMVRRGKCMSPFLISRSWRLIKLFKCLTIAMEGCIDCPSRSVPIALPGERIEGHARPSHMGQRPPKGCRERLGSLFPGLAKRGVRHFM